jgi:hypothetical protein
MKFCPVVPEICCGQVHGARKERRITRTRRRIIIIIRRNGAKTLSLGDLININCNINKCGHRNVLSKRQVWMSIFH